MSAEGTFAGRYVVERLAGTGGMASVYKARDCYTGSYTALKVLELNSSIDRTRFNREARLLAEISHPGVAAYVAHGVTADGLGYLAMEWLDGEDLATRVERCGALPVGEVVTLMLQVAEALIAVHARGIVHRDIKPSNLFLTGGEPPVLKLLDFGISRADDRASPTRTGAILGTPEYMAPEQARGEKNVGSRADIFSWGCVVFECLTGQPPFGGENPIAVLAKILLEDAPSVHASRPDVPDALAELVASMLAKDPGARPADATMVRQALAGITLNGASVGRVPRLITDDQQRLACVLLASPGPGGAVPLTGRASLELLEKETGRHGGQLCKLIGGSMLGVFLESSAATDMAAKAARCALSLVGKEENLPVALATGRTAPGGTPLGLTIDRAVDLVEAARARRGIVVDGVTAGLLERNFEIRRQDSRLWLDGVRGLDAAGRTLLGKVTPCVGRERELATLESLIDECVNEPCARVAIVTAAPGVGKSRLRYELWRRLAAQSMRIVTWLGRGDPMRAGSPFSMLCQAVQAALGMKDGEPEAQRREKVEARVRLGLGGDDARRVADFLGELLGIVHEDPSTQLLAARRDAMLMGDQLRRAWEDFLAAELARQPVVLMMDDLQWSDLATIQMLDGALRALCDRPFAVIALGRPEVRELFPRMFEERNPQDIRLSPLGRVASERLVLSVLGDSVGRDVVSQVVEQAAGNAFYIEELIRTVAEGQRELPTTVLAMLEARMAGLADEPRKVLRAGSIFGEVFHEAGVSLLLGERPVAAALGDLIRTEWVVARRESRLAGQHEYVFRHSLVRQAAYGTLTDADRTLGHRLAADWLERVGERDPVLLAEHCERGGANLRAAGWYERAAAQALDGNDLSAVVAFGRRAQACGAGGELLGRVKLAMAEAHNWSGGHREAAECGGEAMALFPHGSPTWAQAVNQTCWASNALGRADEVERYATVLADVLRADGGTSVHAICGAHVATQLVDCGRYPAGASLLEKASRFCGSSAEAAAVLAHAVGFHAMYTGELDEACRSLRQSSEAFRALGDTRKHIMDLGNLGLTLARLGDPGAEEVLERAKTLSCQLGLHSFGAEYAACLALVFMAQGQLVKAATGVQEALLLATNADHKSTEAFARTCQALVLAAEEKLANAERAARVALAASRGKRPDQPFSCAVLAHVLLLQGRVDEALPLAQEGHEILLSLGSTEKGDSFVRLVHARTLHAAGQTDAARSAIASAHDRLLAAAGRIKDPALRASFLENVPENAETLALAASWCAAPPRAS